nr:hypothetical protein [Micromonospora sp. CB01531]
MLTHWLVVECDLQDRGIDVGDPDLMQARTWRWLEVRIIGLLSADTRLSRALKPRPDPAQTS